MNRLLKISLPIAVLAAGAGGAATLILNRPVAQTRIPEAVPPLVEVLPVELREVRAQVHSQGTVRSPTQSVLAAEVPGRIVEVSPKFAEGGVVEAGEWIARVDRSDYARAVVQARAALEQAGVRLAREEAEAEVARREWQELHPELPPSPLAARELQVAEARAAVEAARAALEEAEANLARTEILAPYRARIRRKLADLGQFVARGQAVAEIFGVDRAEVPLPVADAELRFLDLRLDARGHAVRSGPEVILRNEFAGAHRQWRGVIERIEGEVDPKTRMLHLIAVVEHPLEGAPLLPGTFVDATISGRTLRDVVVLPRAALRGANRVWVVDGDDRLRMREVEVVRAGRDEVWIRSGLERGERVCVTPLEAVADGMRVRTAS